MKLKISVGLLTLALLGGFGCQSSSKDSLQSGGGTDPGPLLAQIPADLRFKPKPEDLDAQDRYVRAVKAILKDPLRHRGYYSGQSFLPCTPETLNEIRQIIRTGPIELGYDELFDDPQGSFSTAGSPAAILSASASIGLKSGKNQQAVEDLCLMVKWITSLDNHPAEFTGMNWEYSRKLTEAFQGGALTKAEKLKILGAFPSKEAQLEAQRNQVKMALEDRVTALAALSAPRKDLTVSRFGPVYSSSWVYGYPGQGSRGPTILVPPHGTLDRQQTLEDLIELARILIKQIDLGGINPNDPGRNPPADMVKWLPTMPMLRTSTKREVEARKKQVKKYVDEMNKGENTLGREFIRSGLGVTIQSPVPNGLADLYRSLTELTENPPPPRPPVSGGGRPRVVR